MSSMNGALSSAPPADFSNYNSSLSAKRKRDDTIDGNGVSKPNSLEAPGQSAEASRALIRDLIDVLKAEDIVPSILTRSLPDRPSSSGPQAKRQKSEEDSENSTSVLTRFSANTYSNVAEVLRDIDTAVADIIDKLQPPNDAARDRFIPASATQSEISIKATTFKQRAHKLVARELAATGHSDSWKANGATNGSNSPAKINVGSSDNKIVLTLYGNAPGPKQLFSSLQIPTNLEGQERNLLQSVREAGLPNGITTTQIVPIQVTGVAEDKTRVPTLGELFPTPSTVPALQPPKPSKIATTRSSTVGWYQPSAIEPVSRSASYFKQAISTGQWLDYSNASPPQQGTKRKQRDRAISFGGTKVSSVENEPAESEASKLEALFRGAYSSFAPTRDDSAAVVPVGVMNRLWWQEVGEIRFGNLVENWNSMEEATRPPPALENKVEDEELAVFEKLVEEYDSDLIDPDLATLDSGIEKSVEEKDVDEIIEGISELLETLHSYQRIRHMSLSSSSRPAGLLSVPDTTSLGTPSKPSEPEQATYEILKSQLILMISTLPPFAVAKLDPDRLADLAISTKIEIRATNYKGVMEDDEVAARAKVAALSAATAPRPTASMQTHRSSSASLYGNQYTSSPRPVPAVTQQYYNSAQTPIRPPSNNMQRPPATAPVPYQIQRPPGSAPYRPSPAYGTPTYPHQAPRPVQQQYAPSNQQQYQPAPVGQNYSQNFMRTQSQSYQSHTSQQASQAPNLNGRYTGQSQTAYPHQVQPVSNNGMNYQYANSSNVNRQASPQKMYSPQSQNVQPRAGYSTPTPAPPVPQNRQPYTQNNLAPSAMNGSASQQTPQQQHASQTPSGYSSSFLTTQEQSSLMERQRAQLVAQQAQQQQARSTSQSSMGPSSNNQANGVAAGL
ncbi:hypothetical protein QTJ16_002115 [Diplocarpon rosae]|uniref:Uncharacterized protein n=1 Tax=Diplocarpon rosae TaxID=946125 RepID=A0AAD9WES5_9HELO|nr:hypothetical protein QTJ16_002115 [Diplocarpon rosae]PBP15544.1 hypothetical protein BUE80_DR013728 [Diplocarpon rosae]